MCWSWTAQRSSAVVLRGGWCNAVDHWHGTGGGSTHQRSYPTSMLKGEVRDASGASCEQAIQRQHLIDVFGLQTQQRQIRIEKYSPARFSSPGELASAVPTRPARSRSHGGCRRRRRRRARAAALRGLLAVKTPYYTSKKTRFSRFHSLLEVKTDPESARRDASDGVVRSTTAGYRHVGYSLTKRQP